MPTGTVKTKTVLQADIDANIPTGGSGNVTNAILNVVLSDLLASYENLVVEYTTAARNALTPFQGQKIFNTTNLRMEIYSDATGEWLPASQKTIVATDCSGNPNYPEGGVGDQLICSVAGKIGGASGKSVYVGDLIYCIAKNAGGTEASVGTDWQVCYSNDSTDVPTRYVEIDLSSAEILALNATPKQIVAAPGAGKIILPMSFVVNFTYAGVAYATNTSLQYGNPTGTYVTIFNLNATASKISLPDWGGTEAISNEKLEIKVATGNPTAGTGTATIGLFYKIVTL